MLYNFDIPVDRRDTYSLKWDAGATFVPGCEESGKEPIAVFTADMDFVCAESIRQEIQKVVDRNCYGYTYITPDVDAFRPYYDAIRGWFSKHYHWEVNSDDIIYVPGTLKAIEDAIYAFSNVGDGVIITPPVYSSFAAIIQNTERQIVRNPMHVDNGYYTFDFEDLEEKAKNPRNKILLLCSPHNPAGRVWTKEELQRLYRICKENDVIIISDEVHADLTRVGVEFCAIGSVCDGENLIVCTAPNKSFNIADLNCTNVVITNPELKAKFKQQIGFVRPHIFTVAALIGAYSEGGEEWLNQVRSYIDGNIDWIESFIEGKMPQLKFWRPEGTYILWLDFSGYGMDPDEVDARIIKKCGVMLERGEYFDAETGKGYQRICIPTQRAVVQEVFERFAAEFNAE